MSFFNIKNYIYIYIFQSHSIGPRVTQQDWPHLGGLKRFSPMEEFWAFLLVCEVRF